MDNLVKTSEYILTVVGPEIYEIEDLLTKHDVAVEDELKECNV